jgi:hypothetical protein
MSGYVLYCIRTFDMRVFLGGFDSSVADLCLRLRCKVALLGNWFPSFKTT